MKLTGDLQGEIVQEADDGQELSRGVAAREKRSHQFSAGWHRAPGAARKDSAPDAAGFARL